MLTKKFLLYFFAPLAIFLLGAEGAYYSFAASRLRGQVDRNLTATAEALDRKLSQRLERVGQELLAIATSPVLDEFRQPLSSGHAEAADGQFLEMREDLLSVARRRPEYHALRLFDSRGRMLVGVVDGAHCDQGVDAHATEWFGRTMALAEDAVHISNAETVDDTPGVIHIACPVGAADRRVGVLAVEVVGERLFEEAIANHIIGRGGHFFVVDAAGRIVAHRESSRIGESTAGAPATKRALAGLAGTTFVREEPGGTRMRRAYRPLDVSDLALIVSVPEDEMLAPLADLRSMLLPLLLGGVVVVGLFGLLLVRRIIAPMERLTAAMARASRGDLAEIPVPRTRDERAALAEGFNALVRALSAEREKVREQTVALARAAYDLGESEESLRITLDSIGEAVIATDDEGRITRLNPVAEELFGTELYAARGERLTDIVRLVDRDTGVPIRSPVERVLETGETVDLPRRTVLIANDGTEHHVADCAAPIRDGQGRLVGTVLVLRDVSESLLLEERLRQSQKMDSIGQLAGGVAHDFNNQLLVILGNAELLADEWAAHCTAEQLASVESIISACHRASGLISQLLTFSRERVLAPVVLELDEVIQDVVAMASRTFDKRIEIRVEIAFPGLRVRGEKTALEAALLNLAINARDAMPAGGALVLSSDVAELEPNDSPCRKGELVPGTYVCLEVTDTGSGMEPALCDRIFEPFFTTKGPGGGTGLGLATAYGTTVAHGGTIQVESRVGAGTTMRIHLPLVLEESSEASHLAGEVLHGAGHILLVDDEPAILRSTAAHLERLGYAVTEARHGAEAVELFREDPRSFDLVLLDMIMPTMGGRETLEHLIAIRPDVRCLIISGHSEGREFEHTLHLGACGFLAKPFRVRELSQAVAEALRHEGRTGVRHLSPGS